MSLKVSIPIWHARNATLPRSAATRNGLVLAASDSVLTASLMHLGKDEGPRSDEPNYYNNKNNNKSLRMMALPSLKMVV